MEQQHAPLTLVDGWPLAVAPNPGQTRIRDLDLAGKLAYARPRDIRLLIKRLLDSGALVDVHVRDTVQRTSMPRGGEREVAVTEYWLTLPQALKVCAQAETAVASGVTDQMIAVFLRVPQLLAGAEEERRHYVALCVQLEARDAASIWEREVIDEICRCCGKPKWGGEGRFPLWLRGPMAIIYRHVLGEMLWRELRARCPAPTKGDTLYQHFTEAKHRIVAADMGTVRYMLRTSSGWRDFTAKLRFHYGDPKTRHRQPLQLPLGGGQ